MLTYDGETQRERNISRLHRDIYALVPNNPAYKEVLINDQKRNVVITSTLDTTVKNIEAMPGDNLCVGNHVVYCGHDYWITDASVDDGIYAYGKMTLCNDIVRFISDFDGSIVEYPTIITNTTKFNTGETPNKRLSLPSGQYSMVLPIDEHTILIDNGTRFLLDRRTDYPSAYKVTYVDTATYNYDDGLLSIILLQTEFDPDIDNAELMIADYWKKHKDDVAIASATISFDYDDPCVRVGGTGSTFVPTISALTALPLQFTVSVPDEIRSCINYETTDTAITILAENNLALIGGYFKLMVSDANNENQIEVLIPLRGLI